MLTKITHSVRAGNIAEVEALLRMVGETSPAPNALSPWTICIAAGVALLDLLGRLRTTSPLLQVLAANVRAAGDREPIASSHLHSFLAYRTAYAEEEPMEGLKHAETSEHISRATGQRRFVEVAKLLIGVNRWYLGALTDTDRMIMEVTLSDNEFGFISAYRPFVLAWLLSDRGNLDEARLWARRLIEAGCERALPLDEARGRWVLAEVLRRTGELEAADAEIQAAVAILRLASLLDTPGALATLAALRLAQGRTSEARAAADEGLAKYEAMGACGFFRGVFLRLVHAQCLKAAEDHEAARAAIAAARARLFAIAAKIDDPEYRKSFLEGVPENRETLALARQWLVPAEAN